MSTGLDPHRKVRTLTRTLLVWLTVPLFILLLLSAYFTYRNAANLAEAERDLALEEVTDDIEESIHSILQKGQAIPDHLQTINLILSDPKDQRYFSVYDQQGRLIAGDRHLRVPPFPRGSGEHVLFSRSSLNGAPVRVALLVNDKDKLPGYQIVVAETLNRRSKLALHLGRAALIPQAVIFLLAFPLIWFGVRKGLSPLEKLQNSITLRSAQDLEAIPIDNAPRELQPVVAALNGLLSRVKASQNEQRRFIADAAHQIKTPLAALTAEIDLSLSDTSCSCAQPALIRLKQATSRLAHLVRQLLALAHSESTEAQKNAWFDLAELAREITSDHVSAAAKRRIDLGFEGTEQSAPVYGNAVLIREAMKNLMENALKFTPEGGIVTIAVEASPPVFSVADSGPGIPETELPLIFQRFHRAADGNPTEGSGLGLAIVQEVARRHHATVTVGKSTLGGALFQLRFGDLSVSQS